MLQRPQPPPAFTTPVSSLWGWWGVTRVLAVVHRSWLAGHLHGAQFLQAPVADGQEGRRARAAQR